MNTIQTNAYVQPQPEDLRHDQIVNMGGVMGVTSLVLLVAILSIAALVALIAKQNGKGV